MTADNFESVLTGLRQLQPSFTLSSPTTSGTARKCALT